MKKLISLKNYLDKGKTFVIPNYQRGYIWGKSSKSNKNSVEYILDTIKDGFSKRTDIFLQGVTVSEDKNSKGSIELIDGQQRTVFFYLLFRYLGYVKTFEIKYEVRDESESFLCKLSEKSEKEILELSFEDAKEEYQDIFFFKKTLRIINGKLNSENKDKEALLSYLLEKIKFLYIDIPKEKAIKTFTMMNGSKAIMLPEELVKAELLRQISLISPENAAKPVIHSAEPIEEDQFHLSIKQENPQKEFYSKEWEINALRSRYAREWDKWLYWWNREDVRYFFDVQNPMGLLLEYYYLKNGKEKVFSFGTFKNEFLSEEERSKVHFKGLRNLQKSFEDIYNDPIIYNLLGVSLKDYGNDKYKIIIHFIDNKHNIDILKDFTKWRVIGATFKQITTDKKSEKEEEKVDKAQTVLEALSQKLVYDSEGDSFARKYLLFLNILEDNKANDGKGRKFNLHIFDRQSLEHIHPKSKCFDNCWDIDKDVNDREIGLQRPYGNEWICRDCFPENISEHSIGNLVLLDGNNNSQFGDKTFNEKKNLYFDLKTTFRSRDLLHTMSVFSKEKWGIDEIIENQNNIITGFKQRYGLNTAPKTYDNE